jgi:GNAT superfamily N-acetyltransferase
VGTRAGRSTRVIRLAEAADLAVLHWLDDAAFPASDLDARRAEPGELEAGVEGGHIHLLECAGNPVGYLAVRPDREQVYLSAMAVRPDLQGRGFGGQLLGHVLRQRQEDAGRRPVVTVTSPRNDRMLRLLFRYGFTASSALRDFFGPGQHRLGCELPGAATAEPGDARRVPAEAVPAVFRLMERHQLVIRGLVTTPRGPAFELVPRAGPADDLPPARFRWPWPSPTPERR